MQYVRDYCLINGATGVIEAERQAADAKRQQSKEAAVESGRLQGERAKEILQNAARKRNKLVQLNEMSDVENEVGGDEAARPVWYLITKYNLEHQPCNSTAQKEEEKTEHIQALTKASNVTEACDKTLCCEPCADSG